MTVLHICDYAAAYRGNFIESLEALNTRLSLDGGKTVYAFPERLKHKNVSWPQELSAHTDVYFYKETKFGSYADFKKIISEQKPDIVHTHFTDLGKDFCVDLACAGKKITKIKNYESSYGIWNPIKKLAGKIIYRGWKAIGVSSAIDKEIEANTPFCPHRYINNAVMFSRLDDYEPIDKAKIFPSGGIKCLMFAYNYKLKGADLAVKAISKLREKNDICLAISVPSHLDDIKSQIIQQLGSIPDWITLLPPRNDIASYYNACDIFLSPSRREGFCYSIVEAAYCKSIVVASDCPGQTSHAKENMSVFWFKNKDSDDLSKKIEDAIPMINDDKFKEENKQSAVSNYSIDRWTDEVLRFYNEYSTF
ncbi:MAG: glycosyltransferase family 4 protein [Clostridia bacterium]|nr:glycosyltransferase family 4 protein [Clostridia bacterium]